MQAVRNVVRNGGFDHADRYGPNVIRSIEALMREIETTARRGYGLAVNEAEPGVTAMRRPCAPGPRGPAVGTVSIAGPSVRMTESARARARAAGRACAAELSSLWPLRRGNAAVRVAARRDGVDPRQRARRPRGGPSFPSGRMKVILLGCIADDFTGATDLANNLVRAGMRVVQTIGVPARRTARSTPTPSSSR